MRKNLLYKYFGEQLLKDLALSLKIPGIIDARDARTWRLKVNWPYLKEINLVFDEQKAYLSFAFGARQSDSLVMINNANKWLIDSKDFYSSGKIMQSFHLQYYRGRNIKESYVASFFNSIDDYISYWINHKTLIRKRSPEEAIILYYQFLQDGIITQDEYGSLFNRLNGKKNPVLTIPEILYEPEWQYDTLAAIGIEQFESELFDSSKMILSAFGLYK
jgi:hypothetical protein